jgi:RimJ/RimL family protein N-acetyltransferase
MAHRSPGDGSDAQERAHIGRVGVDAGQKRVAKAKPATGRRRCPELAAEVVDELQGLGIGTALARLTVKAARDNGLELLRATTLADNNRARGLLRGLGFRPMRRSGRELEFALPLD